MAGASARADAGQEHGRRGRLGLPGGQLRPDHGVYHMRKAGMKMRNHDRWLRPRNRKRRYKCLFIPVRAEPVQENKCKDIDKYKKVDSFCFNTCLIVTVIGCIICIMNMIGIILIKFVLHYEI